jgi:NADPH2:quinone reductase
VSDEAGACLGLPAQTAAPPVTLADAGRDTTIFISGGAGAVAHYAIQFAKARGARVITTVSSPEKAALARAAGADHTIDYRQENIGERVMEFTAKRGADAIIEMDLTANAKLIPGVLRQHGSVVVYGTLPEATIPAAFCLVNSITLKFFLVYELNQDERSSVIATIDKALTENRLVHNVAQSFPLDQIVAAHEAMESGRVPGNIVLKIT